MLRHVHVKWSHRTPRALSTCDSMQSALCCKLIVWHTQSSQVRAWTWKLNLLHPACGLEFTIFLEHYIPLPGPADTCIAKIIMCTEQARSIRVHAYVTSSNTTCAVPMWFNVLVAFCIVCSKFIVCHTQLSWAPKLAKYVPGHESWICFRLWPGIHDVLLSFLNIAFHSQAQLKQFCQNKLYFFILIQCNQAWITINF